MLELVARAVVEVVVTVDVVVVEFAIGSPGQFVPGMQQMPSAEVVLVCKQVA